MTRKGMAPTLTNPRHVLQSAQQYNSGNAAHEINGSVCRVCADRRIRRLSGRPYRGTMVGERELAGVSCLFLPGILDCLDICGPADGTEDCLTQSVFFGTANVADAFSIIRGVAPAPCANGGMP